MGWLEQQFWEMVEGFLGTSLCAGVAAETALWWASLVEVLRAVGGLLWCCDFCGASVSICVNGLGGGLALLQGQE